MRKKQPVIDILFLARTKKFERYDVVERTEAGAFKRSQAVIGKKEWAKQAAELVRLKWLTGDE